MEEKKITSFDCDTCDRKRGSKECETCISNANDTTSIPSKWIGKKEAVNHPSHYQSKSGLEAIDVIEAFCDGLNGIEAFCTGNALKYLCRWKSKNGLEDLKKAQWYINKLIECIEKPNATSSLDNMEVNLYFDGETFSKEVKKAVCKSLEKENK